MSDYSDFWRRGGTLSARWAGKNDDSALPGEAMIECLPDSALPGEAMIEWLPDSDPLPGEDTPMIEWLRMTDAAQRDHTATWIAEVVRRRREEKRQCGP